MKALFAPALLLSASLLVAQNAAAPDAIYYNGHIVTGEGLAEGHPVMVTALAVEHGKVRATGPDAGMLRLAGPATQKIDLHGAFAMPGFNDAHLHLGFAGQTKLNVDLTGSASLADMLGRIREAAQESPAGHWLVGAGWDHTLWKNRVLPIRAEIDAVSGNHPAIFSRIDGHISIANSAALRAAGITHATPDPEGGRIDRNAQGEPTGILRETAAMLVEKIVPRPTPEDRRRGLELAIQDAIRHGLTSAQDNSDWEDFLVLEEMEKEKKLALRITEWLPFDAPVEQLKAMRAHHSLSDPLLHTGMLKGFMDGSLGSRTAALKAPYSDEPANAGIPRYTQEKLDAMTQERIAAGFQIGFHAIGDRAAAMALHAYRAAETTPGGDKLRLRIEHAQVVDPADIELFRKLGVLASMQPNHLLTDMNWARQRLGDTRAAYSYAWKSFLSAGIPLAFGTDYPVEPVTPFRGVYAAITRQNEAGTASYFPENRLTRGQTLAAYTQGSAYAEFTETRKGVLKPGFYADFVVLDRDLLKVPPAEILKTSVQMTVMDGQIVYCAPK